MDKLKDRFLPFTLMLIVIMLVNAADASAWWNENWKYRKKITFDATTSGGDITGTVTDVPVLIRLHTGNFVFQQAKQDGSDIRFVGGDDLTQLKHHFEVFDAVEEMAIVWVKVPKISASSKQDFIYVYYGNPDATKGEDRAGTFDKNTVALFHFGEAEGQPKDMTGYNNNAATFAGSLGLPSIIGKGVSFSGGNDKMVIPSNPSLDMSGGFTFSAWVKVNTPQKDTYLLSREEGDNAITIGIDNMRLYCRLKNGKDDTLMTNDKAVIPSGDWHHVAVTAEHKGKLALYIDAAQVYSVDLASVLPNIANEVYVGASGKGDHAYAGEMDELSLSNTARSDAWVKAVSASQNPQSKLCAFGNEEGYDGGGHNKNLQYIGVVFRETTASGWAIIAITFIIFAWSVVIFVDKINTIRNMVKGNNEFRSATGNLTDIFDLKEEEDSFGTSSLYQIFREGRSVLERRFSAKSYPGYLTRSAINSFQVELERNAVLVTQKLNSKLVILTIAIAGGPFLGLLGTVWGVMNTFAAMALVGEANIMAIAPGVASALACTISGLLLAIPALFSYNYLTTVIKSISAEMYIFIDELGANIEENYSEESVRTAQHGEKRAVI
jgi:biopolymer transport protein ExbB